MILTAWCYTLIIIVFDEENTRPLKCCNRKPSFDVLCLFSCCHGTCNSLSNITGTKCFKYIIIIEVSYSRQGQHSAIKLSFRVQLLSRKKSLCGGVAECKPLSKKLFSQSRETQAEQHKIIIYFMPQPDHIEIQLLSFMYYLPSRSQFCCPRT